MTQHHIFTQVQNWQIGLLDETFGAPGLIHQNDGTEGKYFEGTYPGDAADAGAVGTGMEGTCPVAPDVVGIATGSPVNLRIKNSLGQQVVTSGAQIRVNELGRNFFAYKFFDDSNDTIDWGLGLPPDRYEIELIGSKTGPYTLTLTTFDQDGEPIETQRSGTTYQGRSDNFVVALSRCPENPVDSDSDDVCNGVDNCPLVPNRDQADGDGDGWGDLCDSCTGSDTDGDGVCDDIDNCPAEFNPMQYDEEGDGFGDACDPCPSDDVNDPDSDGICAYEEFCAIIEPCDPAYEDCPGDPNANQADLDKDGLGDVCDDDGSFADVDGNGSTEESTDGQLILRHLFGFRGAPLVADAIGADCTRCNAEDVTAYMDQSHQGFDIDGNDSVDALTDGLMIVRCLSGYMGESLIAGAMGEGCTRCSATDITAYCAALAPDHQSRSTQ